MLEGVVGDVARGDLLPVLRGVDEDLGCHRGSVLEKFHAVFTTDGVDSMRDGGGDPGDDLMEEHFTWFWGHGDSLGWMWCALHALALDIEELAPWEFTADTEWVGLEAVGGRDYRLANVLGKAEEVFAAVIYQRTGIGWLLKVLDDDFDPEDLNAAVGMDCLKLEFVTKRELVKAGLAVLKAVGFKPARRGCSWPQFRSSIPGWHPWHISRAEAELWCGE